MATTTVQTHDWRTQAANQTRLAFGQALLEVAARDPKTVVLSADTQDLLGIRPYMARYPERFVEVGIAEQNLIGVASGLATTGLHAYVRHSSARVVWNRCATILPMPTSGW
jgi:transketolase C-terminal domain/subunit